MASPRAWIEISIGGFVQGRVVFELYDSILPKTCENFRALCTGEHGVGKATGVSLHYKGCSIHRVMKGVMIQGGDIPHHNGSGSVFGDKFDDKAFLVSHSRAGMLSMANAGPHSNGSQFFVTCAPTPHLDKKHVAFGRVVSGMEVVRAVEAVNTTSSGEPSRSSRVLISDCGITASSADRKRSKKRHREDDNDRAGKKRRKEAKKLAKKAAKTAGKALSRAQNHTTYG